MDTLNKIDMVCKNDFGDGSEMQILTWRTLINLVKPNSILYEKKKGHSKKYDKDLIWNHIGNALVPPMTGFAAKKEFYYLRHKFVAERRKIVQSQARSGADGNNNVTYTSNWILYNDLMFLANHIRPRQTKSNYERSVSQKIPHVQTLQHLVTSTPSYPSASTRPSNSSDSSDCGSISNEDEGLSSTADSVDSCLSSPITSNKSSTKSNNAFTSMLGAMASAIIPQKQIPSDIVKKRKRSSIDGKDKTMLESAKNISSLASTLETVLKGQISTRATLQQTPEVQNMIGSIALGLSKVPVECHMDCLISVLSCINQFVKK